MKRLSARHELAQVQGRRFGDTEQIAIFSEADYLDSFPVPELNASSTSEYQRWTHELHINPVFNTYMERALAQHGNDFAAGVAAGMGR